MIQQEDDPDRSKGADRVVSPDDREQSLLAAIARAELHNRRRRDSLIRFDFFAEPAWDLMLELYVAHRRRRPVNLTRLCAAAACAPTTMLRWIGLLMEKQLVMRMPQARENADMRLTLSVRGVEEMERYLRDFLHREQLGGDIAAALRRI